jgi:hypothetical protein
MASVGPNSAGAGADDASVGTVAWTNPGNIVSSNDSRATATLNQVTSHYLAASTFGFSIPAGSSIDGITVEIERSDLSARVKDNIVRLYKNGTGLVGDNKAITGPSWPNTDTYQSYGGATDTWGTTWTATDINDAGFGVWLSATNASNSTGRVDHIRITVAYTTPAGFLVIDTSASA